MIRVEDIFVVFCRGTPLERIALRGIDFTVQTGEIVSLVGNNGSGKSTLLQFLAGHISPSFGRLWLDKTNITSQSLSERSAIFSSVFYDQNVGTAENLTVAENLAAASMHHQPLNFIEPALTRETKEMFFEQLKDLDFMRMEDLLDEKVKDISRAHRQILAMLIAVIKEAKVLLISEHSTGLDRETSAALLEATEKIIRSKNITTIMVINNPKFAFDVSDRVLILSHGGIVSNIGGEEK
jgi:putative ABC transport system ATP-binding protein